MEIKLILKNKNFNQTFNILLNNEVIGWISLREEKDSVHIDSINLCKSYQRKGIGTILVKQLLSKYKVIYGFSSPLAVKFWEKVGAQFEYKITEEMISTLMHYGEYPPFYITTVK